MDRSHPVARITEKVSGSALFAKIAPSLVPRLDRLVYKLTGGRRMMSQGPVPTLMLTAIGAKSGEPRLVPLACIPDEGCFYLVGSNFGRQNHPAWTTNLMKNPRAEATFEGKTFVVDAHLLDSAEKAHIWPHIISKWPNFDIYVERSGRDLRVFRLDPVENP